MNASRGTTPGPKKPTAPFTQASGTRLGMSPSQTILPDCPALAAVRRPCGRAVRIADTSSAPFCSLCDGARALRLVVGCSWSLLYIWQRAVLCRQEHGEHTGKRGFWCIHHWLCVGALQPRSVTFEALLVSRHLGATSPARCEPGAGSVKTAVHVVDRSRGSRENAC